MTDATAKGVVDLVRPPTGHPAATVTMRSTNIRPVETIVSVNVRNVIPGGIETTTEVGKETGVEGVIDAMTIDAEIVMLMMTDAVAQVLATPATVLETALAMALAMVPSAVPPPAPLRRNRPRT